MRIKQNYEHQDLKFKFDLDEAKKNNDFQRNVVLSDAQNTHTLNKFRAMKGLYSTQANQPLKILRQDNFVPASKFIIPEVQTLNYQTNDYYDEMIEDVNPNEAEMSQNEMNSKKKKKRKIDYDPEVIPEVIKSMKKQLKAIKKRLIRKV